MVVTTRRTAARAEITSLKEPPVHTKKREKEQKQRRQQQQQGQYKRNVFPIPWHESLYLIVSSCFFLFPGYYAFRENLPFHGVVSIVTTIVSANYWRHAVEGMRRNVDLIVAKVSFMIYCISGFWFARDWRLYAIGVPGMIGIGGCYYLSNNYWDRDLPGWVYFQMLFHIFVAFEQALVIYAMA